MARLLADAPGRIDVVVVDGYGRLSSNHQELGALIAHVGALGVPTVELRPTGVRRLSRFVANLALADLIGIFSR